MDSLYHTRKPTLGQEHAARNYQLKTIHTLIPTNGFFSLTFVRFHTCHSQGPLHKEIELEHNFGRKQINVLPSKGHTTETSTIHHKGER